MMKAVSAISSGFWPLSLVFLIAFGLLSATCAHADWFQAPEYAERLPSANERAEIAALPPASTPPRGLFLGREDFSPLLSCILTGQDPAHGSSLVLKNRCNIGLAFEGYVTGIMQNGTCPSSAGTEQRSYVFATTLLPGEADKDFERWQNCLAQIHSLKVHPPELLFEERYGGQIESLEEWQNDAEGNRIWWQKLEMDLEASSQFPASDLCFTSLPVKALVEADGPYEYDPLRKKTYSFLWRGVAAAKVGERSVTVDSSQIAGRNYRINFKAGIDRKLLADAINRILYRC